MSVNTGNTAAALTPAFGLPTEVSYSSNIYSYFYRYFIHYPSRTGKRYQVYIVRDRTRAEVDHMAREFMRFLIDGGGHFSEVDRKTAIDLGWYQPRRARRIGERSYGGFPHLEVCTRLTQAVECAIFAADIRINGEFLPQTEPIPQHLGV